MEIKWKCYKNSSYWEWLKMAKSQIFDEICDKIYIFYEQKMAILAAKSFGGLSSES